MTNNTFGRYEIRAELGRGGMATVYHAFDPHFQRHVALKILPRAFMHDESFRERFVREARSIALLEHWAIVPVYDYGEQDEQPFFVMRFMPGGSLLDRIEWGRLSLDEVTPTIERIATALDFAHRKDVIHRDVKPANILFDEEGDAYLSDFGIVKLTEATAQLTGSGFVGTPTYMAPEMVHEGGVTPLIDVYALGVTLFQALSGDPPYKADTPMGTALAHATQPIPDLCAQCPDLPGELQMIVEGALAKDPADRYQSAGALVADLRSVVAHRFSSASAPEATTLVEAPAVMPEAPLPDAPLAEPTPPRPMATRAVAAPRPASPAARPRRKFPIWVVGLLGLVIVMGLGVALWPRGGKEDVNELVTVEPSLLPLSETPPSSAAPVAYAAAEAGVEANAEWTPYVEEIDGAAMALVPAGCFMMGSEDGDGNETPVHEQCFDEPFWIDVYEVSRAQYGSDETSPDANRPQASVSWFDAYAYCQNRGARLPKEAEWEYVARGPDDLRYPWGDEFVADYVVYVGNSNQSMAVDGNPEGASWVGALAMSGNIYEWVNSIYDDYPYRVTLDREASGVSDSSSLRVIRGGSWVTDNPYGLRAANRAKLRPDASNITLGFRCARSY
jgi:tRNA A-37 threonylcarbamoyl transferase component Bud32